MNRIASRLYLLIGFLLGSSQGILAQGDLLLENPSNWEAPRFALYPSRSFEEKLEGPEGSFDRIREELEKALPTQESSFVGITPCRMVDTRGNGFGGAYGPPALMADVVRDFTLTGHCGVPANAVAVSANFVVVLPSGDGFLATFPAAGAVPLVSTLNFRAGQVLANAAIVPLGTAGAITVYASGANTHVLIDVNGYFVVPPTTKKLCTAINRAGDGWRETIEAPASWTASMCNAFRVVTVPNNSNYQLGCLRETGAVFGTLDGGLPSPNCGW